MNLRMAMTRKRSERLQAGQPARHSCSAALPMLTSQALGAPEDMPARNTIMLGGTAQVHSTGARRVSTRQMSVYVHDQTSV